MPASFEKKIIFITGSSNGIGAEAAVYFAKEGATVIVTYHRDRKAGEMILQRCKEAGSSQSILVELDVSNDASIEQATKKIMGFYGEIHVLVNNAGIAIWKKLQDQTFAEIHEQIGANLEGLIKVTRSCAAFVKETIINVGSGAGMKGYPELTTYCATKFGIRGFTQALAQELVDKKVYCVNPGTTSTRMSEFQGVAPDDVARIIVDAAKGMFDVPSGSDINVWEQLAVA